MANMLDYLDWRGDIPFSADPFNEVDSLVLSEAAYVDFEGLVPGPDEEVPEDFPRRAGMPVVRVTDVVRQYWKLHTKEEIEKTTQLILDCDFRIAPKVYGKENISCKYCDYKDICYMIEKDLVYLDKVEDFSFLGGEE